MIVLIFFISIIQMISRSDKWALTLLQLTKQMIIMSRRWLGLLAQMVVCVDALLTKEVVYVMINWSCAWWPLLIFVARFLDNHPLYWDQKIRLIVYFCIFLYTNIHTHLNTQLLELLFLYYKSCYHQSILIHRYCYEPTWF